MAHMALFTGGRVVSDAVAVQGGLKASMPKNKWKTPCKKATYFDWLKCQSYDPVDQAINPVDPDVRRRSMAERFKHGYLSI